MIPPLARRFVAGETTAGALDHARQCNDGDVGAILNLLGEHYDDPERARADAETYSDLLADLGTTDLRACISVKPSQLGLDVGEDCFRSNLESIVEAAAAADRFIWLDMEDHTTTDATLDAFEATVSDYERMGVCVQANLRRTREDLERLSWLPGKVRLVKGAYDPPTEVAYTDKARVNEAYRECLEYMFEAFEDGIAVGSHDPAMIDLATDLHAAHGTPYELQMLMGVRTEAQFDLATDREVWQYVPYGGAWLSYFYRRLAERRENAVFALRALLGG